MLSFFLTSSGNLQAFLYPKFIPYGISQAFHLSSLFLLCLEFSSLSNYPFLSPFGCRLDISIYFLLFLTAFFPKTAFTEAPLYPMKGVHLYFSSFMQTKTGRVSIMTDKNGVHPYILMDKNGPVLPQCSVFVYFFFEYTFFKRQKRSVFLLFVDKNGVFSY